MLSCLASAQHLAAGNYPLLEAECGTHIIPYTQDPTALPAQPGTELAPVLLLAFPFVGDGASLSFPGLASESLHSPQLGEEGWMLTGLDSNFPR